MNSPVDISSLSAFLMALAAGALTVPIVTWILSKLPPDVLSGYGGKFTVAVVLSFLLGTAGQVALFALGYDQIGSNTREILEQFYPVWLTAFTVSQFIYANMRARGKP